MGDDTSHWEDVGRIPPQVDPQYDGLETSEGGGVGSWVYTPLAEFMEEAWLQDVETYISFHQNTFSQFIAAMSIMDLCLAADRRPWSRVANQ